MSSWISVEDRLPKDWQHVLIYIPCPNLFMPDDDSPAHIIAACFKQGRTAEELEAMDQPSYSSADEWSNNLRPYCWQHFGAGHEFGQHVSHWMPLPKGPKE